MFCYIRIVSLILVVKFPHNYSLENTSDLENMQKNVLHRERRQLLFTNSSVLQLNIGVGTPSPVETININWAFQANFQLPWNRSQIPVDILHANSGYDGESRRETRENKYVNNKEVLCFKRDKYDATDYEVNIKDNSNYENDSRLYHFYKFIEDVLNGHGYNGSSCMLYTLCRIAAEPLYSEDEEDILHEIVSLALNPTHDNENEASQAVRDEAQQYVAAHEHGLKSGDCLAKYDGCPLPLLDMFSALY